MAQQSKPLYPVIQKNRYVFGQINLNRTILFQNGILIIFPSLPQNIKVHKV